MKEIKPFTAEWWLEFATWDSEVWEYGEPDAGIPTRWFSSHVRDFCINRYAEAFHREKMKETLNSILEDMDGTLVEYHHEVVEEYLQELTQKIKGNHLEG